MDVDNMYATRRTANAIEEPSINMTHSELEAMLRKEKEKAFLASETLSLRIRLR